MDSGSLTTAGPNPALTESRWTVRRATDARAYELADEFWCLRLPLRFVAPRSVNAYLIPLAGGYCLVDCGTSLDPGWSALEYALGLAGVAPEQLSLLVCTHLHADHAGLAAEVVARTGCEFARGAGPATPDHRLRDPRVPLDDRRRLARREGIPTAELDEWVEPEPEDDLDYPNVVPDRALVSGDQIHSRLGTWTVVPAPGHSPTQILLHNRGRGWLIMADLAYDVGDPFFEYGASRDPYAEHVASLDRALELDAALAFPGHGRVVESPRHRLRVARTAAQSTRARVLDALTDQPRTAYEIALKLLGPRDDWGERQSMISVVLCLCEHLEAHGLARGEIGSDGIRRFRRA
ncbi:MAG TPA: MBL fold metallo-hydrolase [Solirubrobacteraceae bacterium]|nr:MBL fold metallo-hydrolase [Solirubrobacteraceae bacterium]